MSQLIEELLMFAKIAKEEIKLRPLDPEAIFNALAKRLGQIIKDSGASIHLPQSFLSALGYDGWVEEIFYNLMSNAIKYGGCPPVVTVSCQRSADGKFVSYTITDNGPGLSQEQIVAVFDESSILRKSLIKGHGIGLTISSKIAEKLSAVIEVTSRAGSGSSFTLKMLALSDPNR